MPARTALDLSVYLVTDRELCGSRGTLETVRRAIAAGATIVQMRDPFAKTRVLVEEARALAALLRPAGVPFIVNDRVDVAIAAEADGVHLGQSDMSVGDARALVGPQPIVGLSITSMADLEASDLAGVDYLGVGPVFATATKADAAPAMGLAGLAAVRAACGLPIVAIGGIAVDNAAEVIAAGADGVAVVSAICAAPDAGQATRELADIVAAARRRTDPLQVLNR
jgi:thiamine-phosphate pyrophosphorylase